MINRAADIGALTLIVLALVKLFIMVSCLTTGWKGGYIFSTMFAGAALFVAVLVQTETSPVIAIAVIVGVSATARLSMTSDTQPAGASKRMMKRR